MGPHPGQRSRRGAPLRADQPRANGAAPRATEPAGGAPASSSAAREWGRTPSNGAGGARPREHISREGMGPHPGQRSRWGALLRADQRGARGWVASYGAGSPPQRAAQPRGHAPRACGWRGARGRVAIGGAGGAGVRPVSPPPRAAHPRGNRTPSRTQAERRGDRTVGHTVHGSEASGGRGVRGVPSSGNVGSPLLRVRRGEHRRIPTGARVPGVRASGAPRVPQPPGEGSTLVAVRALCGGRQRHGQGRLGAGGVRRHSGSWDGTGSARMGRVG